MRKGWEYKKLGEVCTLISDGSHNPPKGIDHSLYRMISSQNVFDDNLQITEDNVRYITESDHLCENKRTKLQKDVVLLTIVGTIGRSCVLKGNEGCLTLQRSVAALHPSDQIMPRYLMHCLIGNRHTLNQEAHGIAQKGIYLKQLSSLSIPLPPKSTQQAIVSELDKINELIRLKKEQLKDFDNLAQSLFYEMFGDPVENEKGWEVKKLDNVCNITSSKRIFADEYTETGIPFYRSKEVIERSKGLPISVELFISEERYNEIKEKFGVPKIGDILITAVGTIGKIWAIDTDNKFYFKDGNLVWLKDIDNQLANSCFFRRLLEYLIEEYKKTNANGAAYNALTIAKLKLMSCPLPPLSLQRLFAQSIEQIEREKSEVQKSIQDLETLLASRMQYWFE